MQRTNFSTELALKTFDGSCNVTPKMVVYLSFRDFLIGVFFPFTVEHITISKVLVSHTNTHTDTRTLSSNPK